MMSDRSGRLPDDKVLEYRAELLARSGPRPAELAAAIAAMPEAEWHARQDGEGRTVHWLAAHVRDLEVLAYGPLVRRIVTEAGPALEPYPSHEWSRAFYTSAEPMTQILAQLSQARAEVVAQLRPLAGPDWNRVGFHPPSGQRT